MLTLTPEAAEAVTRLTEGRAATGLRMRRTEPGERPMFGLELAQRPGWLDEVIEHDDARVYLDRATAKALRGKRLEARPGEGGQVEFSLKPRP